MVKYIKVRFPGASREYTYECDDDTVQPTDDVSIVTPNGQTLVLPVVEVSGNKPPFACKPAMKVQG